MAITGDDQFYLPSRSFLFGDGTAFSVVRFNPNRIQTRRNPMDRVASNGSIVPRSDLLGARTIEFELEVTGTSRSDLQTNLDALATATAPSSSGDEVLQFQILGSLRRVNCRPDPPQWLWDVTGDTGLLVQAIGLTFFCQDPRIYVDSTSSVTLA